MTTLLTGAAAMGLLPDRHPPRRIFLEPRALHNLLIQKQAAELELTNARAARRSISDLEFMSASIDPRSIIVPIMRQ